MRQLLKQLVTINRPTVVSDGSMGTTITNTAIYTNLAASIQPASSSTMYFYAQRQLKVGYTIFVCSPVTMVRGDTITDGTRTYQFVGARDLSGRGRVTALDCELYT